MFLFIMRYKFILGSSLVFIGAVCFSAKAVIVKLAYAYAVDPVSLLALRMLFSLPFFIAIGVIFNRKQKVGKVSLPDWWNIILLGIVGYYLSSLFDFLGLRYTTASLERLILFIYPTLVVVIVAIVYRKRIAKRQYFALALTYIGIFIAFAFDVALLEQPNLVLGAGLIFCSAITYAIYLIGSGKMIPKVGTIRFTAYAMICSAIAVLIHTYFVNGLAIWNFETEVYVLSLAMAIGATVIPSFMISGGIKLVGADNAAIIGSVGPVSTIVLAYIFLQEIITVSQLIGTVFVLGGVLMITLKKDKKEMGGSKAFRVLNKGDSKLRDVAAGKA